MKTVRHGWTTRIASLAMVSLWAPMCMGTLLVEHKFDEAPSGTTAALNTGTASGGTLTFKNDATRTSSVFSPTNVAALDLTLGASPSNNDSAEAGAGGIAAVDNLTQYTLSFWINLRGTPNASDRILETGGVGAQIQTSTGLGGVTPVSPSAFYLRLTRNSGDGSFFLSPVSLDASNRWLFMAVTVDYTGGSDFATYYSGTETNAVASLGNYFPAGADRANSGDSTQYVIGDFTTGNSGTDRTPPAWIDNVRLYDTKLTLSQLESLRQLDVPEPATGGLILLGCALLWRRRRGND